MLRELISDGKLHGRRVFNRMEELPLFQYPAVLPPDLRLLELNPGKPSDTLTGTMLHREFSPDIDEIPEYAAVSYCWGDQSQPDSITLEQEHDFCIKRPLRPYEVGRLQIGRNLAAALRALRYRQQKRRLWTDYICINQNDLSERAAQVQRMHLIYSYAASVIIWLGLETPWSTMAMETLQSTAHLIESVSYDPRLYRHILTFEDPATENLFKAGVPLTSEQWQAVEKMMALD